MLILALAAVACAPKQDRAYGSDAALNSAAESENTIVMTPSDYRTSNPEGMQQVCDFIKACGTYYIASVETTAPADEPAAAPALQARVRPFGTIHIFEGKLYIQTGHVKDCAKQFAVNPNVELCAFNGNEWIRVSGTLVDDPRVEAKKDMLDDYSSLRRMYDENDANTAVFFFTNAKARICSFTAPEKVIEF